jgi:hypothetical protein
MKYQKGQSGNPAGRKAGKVNRSTEQLRNIFQEFLENNVTKLQEDFDQLEPKDRLMFIEKVARMVIPPPLTLEALNEAALDALIDRLKNDTGQPAAIYIDKDDVDL